MGRAANFAPGEGPDRLLRYGRDYALRRSQVNTEGPPNVIPRRSGTRISATLPVSGAEAIGRARNNALLSSRKTTTSRGPIGRVVSEADWTAINPGSGIARFGG